MCMLQDCILVYRQPAIDMERYPDGTRSLLREAAVLSRGVGGHGGHMKHMPLSQPPEWPSEPVPDPSASQHSAHLAAIDAAAARARWPRKDAKYHGMLRAILRTVLPLNGGQRFGGCCLGYSCLADPSPDIPARPNIAVGSSRPRRGRRGRGRGWPAGSQHSFMPSEVFPRKHGTMKCAVWRP